MKEVCEKGYPKISLDKACGVDRSLKTVYSFREPIKWNVIDQKQSRRLVQENHCVTISDLLKKVTNRKENRLKDVFRRNKAIEVAKG